MKWMFEKWKDGIIFVNDGNKRTCVFNSALFFLYLQRHIVNTAWHLASKIQAKACDQDFRFM